MWFNSACLYQIYPLGLVGAPYENDGKLNNRILNIKNFISHIKKLNCNCVMFNPVFQSDKHGYDTRDYFTIDCRLGTNEDFKQVCKAFHDEGIKVILDAVLNHVGRGFWAFCDVREKKCDSEYCSWFKLSFEGNTDYNDGFWYEAWEGCYDLVKLNLENEAVVNHQFEAIKSWVNDYDIDGLRLDVAYCLPQWYLRKLKSFTNTLKPHFVLIGETLHGDYNTWMADDMCDSVTNYECYKGLHSSFNCMNMFEIGYSLNRQFGGEQWCLYTGKHLLCFADNHDVERVASILNDERQLPALYGMLFGMPGVPSIYYGSEWGVTGKKGNFDRDIRPSFEKPKWNSLTEIISHYAKIKTDCKALTMGNYKQIYCTNKQLVFMREYENEKVLVAVNADEQSHTAKFDIHQNATDMISGQAVDICGEYEIRPFTTAFLKI